MYIDIAANLTDDMFQGIYHDKKRHESDLSLVVDRAQLAGCDKMIVLAGSLEDANKCIQICNLYDPGCSVLFTTIGVHPTRCDSFVNDELTDSDIERTLFDEMQSFLNQYPDRVVAIGEFGLDYDRLHFCSRENQIRGFEIQLRVVEELRKHNVHLPLLLHLRNACDDFVVLMNKYKHVWENCGGVVHSFTGTCQEMRTLTDMGLYIGLNGCSLRQEESLREVVPFIPEDKIIYETDSPYCDIRPTHAGFNHLQGLTLPKTVKPEKFATGMMVKGRNEPACIDQVAAIVARARGTDPAILAKTVLGNTLRLFRKLARP